MTKKILLVEDEKLLSEMYSDKFREAGFEVISTKEAEEALELAKKEKPDLIVLDILLVRANGISFLQKLRETPDIAFTPVVAFSNYDDPSAKKEAFRLGVKDYLIKTNYTPQGIIEKIKGYFDITK
jgi:DNA-binding response OmpR family regulator